MSIGEHAPLDRPLVVPMSWEEYERLDPDVRQEYVSGCLVVNPRPTFRHQVMVRNLTNVLDAACPPDYTAVNEWAWKPEADEWAPDVMVCERDDDAVRFTGIPQVIVEVLSTNRADDLVLKLYRYGAAGLPRYWIADPLEPSVRAYVLRDGIYEEVAHAIGDDEVEFDFSVGRVTLRPSDLLR
ncbi:MAG: Uma2 family endonuclease [Acidimicrobiia bacterium]